MKEIILGILLFITLFLFILLIKILLNKTGNKIILKQLKKLNKSEFLIFNDRILISIYGIFVIETNTHSGLIRGNEKSKYWIQILYKKKTRFKNPIFQNMIIIHALREILLNYPKIVYRALIVFKNNVILNVITSSVSVICVKDLFNTIMEKKMERIITIDQMHDILNILKKISNQKNAKKAMDVCPNCGARLTSRAGLWGPVSCCSNYPKCSYGAY